MRIIAGEHRGRTLIAPKGLDTRPTLDRVRESLFNILMPRLLGARVLDLFAGSGALGLEALSRGAAQAVFVDSAREAQVAVAKNIEALDVLDRAKLLRCDWQAAISRLRVDGAQFDLVFLDPPYRLDEAGRMLESLRVSGLLSAHALVIYEHAKGLSPNTDAWHVADTRRYGDTIITFLAQSLP